MSTDVTTEVLTYCFACGCSLEGEGETGQDTGFCHWCRKSARNQTEDFSPSLRVLVDRIELKQDYTNAQLDKIVELVGAIHEQVQPVIEEISNGPIGKILGVKKQKGKSDE